MVLSTNGTESFASKPEIHSSSVSMNKKMETSLDAQINCMLMKCGAQLTSEDSTLTKGTRTKSIPKSTTNNG